MNSSEQIFDVKVIVNCLLAFAIAVMAIIYFQYENEIKDEVNTVIASSLQDVNNSLAEQEATRK